jgi:hypothetical protein
MARQARVYAIVNESVFLPLVEGCGWPPDQYHPLVNTNPYHDLLRRREQTGSTRSKGSQRRLTTAAATELKHFRLA